MLGILHNCPSKNTKQIVIKLSQKAISIANKVSWGITRAKKFHCLGDSHTSAFYNVARNRFWFNTHFYFCIVQGATATGLANPNSQTQTYPIFQNYLEKLSVKDHLLFCLGEVDCGFVIWYRAQKYNEAPDSQLELALKNYFGQIERCREMGFRHITLCSSPLPTILDGQNWGEVANKRKEITATLCQRTELTRKFNKRLSDYCRINNLQYIDFEAYTFDPQTQIIKDAFRSKDPFDHHLDYEALSSLIIPCLLRMGYW